jgi:RimJ/RimL family protein N-acetyltransferase
MSKHYETAVRILGLTREGKQDTALIWKVEDELAKTYGETQHKDTERLDWLEQNSSANGDEFGWDIRIEDENAENGGFDSLRDLIDSAAVTVERKP